MKNNKIAITLMITANIILIIAIILLIKITLK